MNREDIIRMAREAELCDADGRDSDSIVIASHLERFANLVAAAEREACAKACDALGDEYADANPADCAFVIRERGAP